MKRLIAAIITIAIILTLVPTGVFAASGNLGGGGGSLGNAVNNFYWNPGFCGARITVVTESGTQIGSSFDWLNSSCYGAATYHFGKHSKLYYRGITNINQMSERYGDYAATVNAEMPTIVLASGSNIDWIRSYFTGNSALTAIAARVGANYSDFDGCGYPSIWTTIGGVQTKLCVVIEPIVAVMCGGKPLTCTATELALYAQANAGVQNYLASIYRMQAPLAIYLQHPQLGFRSNPDLGIYWRSREDVISYLGIGIVSFGENGASFEPPVDPEDLPDPEVETPPTSYEYRTSTEVYTSVKVTNNTGADIKDGADIKFHIMGNGIDAEYTHKVLLPKEKSQLAYVKWTTPATVGVCNVAVEADDGIELSCDNVTCNIATYAITEPPDTKLETADPYWHSTAFSTSHSPYGGTTGALEWGHWEWSNIVGGGTINANVYDYNESGYTYYTAWQEAFKSVAEYAETVFQKVQSTKPAIYSSTEWRTKTAIAAEGETVPAPTETQIINIVGSGPVFRTREFLYCKYPIRKDYWYYSRAHRVEVLTPVYGTAWRTYYNAATGVTAPYTSNGYYTQGGVERVLAGSIVSYYWHLHRQEEVFLFYRDDSYTYHDEGTSIPDGYWKTGDVGWREGTLDSFITVQDCNLAGTIRGTRGSIGTEQYYRLVYMPGTPVYTQWSAWTSALPIGYVYDRAAGSVGKNQYQQSSYTTYEIGERSVLSPAEYTYAQRSSDWSDTGSYWYTFAAQVEMPRSTTSHRWVWVKEKAGIQSSTPVISSGMDERNPTANANVIKSGYALSIEASMYSRALIPERDGDNMNVVLSETTNFTSVQHAITVFPEFNWTTYGRVLVGSDGNYTLGVNQYSRYGNRVHFTPIWYPDNSEYYVGVYAFDCWTPAGQLSTAMRSTALYIRGDMYDDWYVTPNP